MKNITFVENIVMMNFPGQKVLSTLHNKIYSGHQETLESIQWSPGNIGKYTVVTRKHRKVYSGHQETWEKLSSSFFFCISKGSDRLCKVVKLSMQCSGKLLSDSFETYYTF